MSAHAAVQKRQHEESAPQNTGPGKSSQAAGVGLPLFMQANPTASAGVTLQRQCADASTPGANDECATCNSGKPLQAKLAIGASDDPLEQEADRVADQVLAMPANPTVSAAPPRIQRYTGQATGETGTAPASVDRVLASSGRLMEPGLRQDMEQRFGHDFSGVRVHSGVAAQQSTWDVNAHAYTVGRDMVFSADRYSPGTHEGRRLIAHELTHVVQQAGAAGTRIRQWDQKRALSPISSKCGVVLARQPSGGANDTAIEAEMQFLRLQLQMPIPPTGPGPILARLYELEKRRGRASRGAWSAPVKKPPAWMSPTSKGPLPGVPVPGYETPRKAYTKEDADAMAAALVKRNEDNAANVGYFLEQYVSAAVEICGLFVSSEMSKAAKKLGFGVFGKLLKFALTEIVMAIATGGSGVFVKGLEKVAAKTLKFLASRGTGFAADYEGDVIEQDLSTPDLDKKQQKWDEITRALSNQVGTLTNTMVSQLGDADTTYLGIWLGKASESSLKDLERFRIPELFPRANRNAIRAVIAGAIAGRAHDHYRAQGIMEESYRTGPGESVADVAGRPSEVHHLDDNVIIAHMTPKAGGANVRDIQFYSTSRVLSKELIGKASIKSMPTVPLLIVVDATETDDDAATKLLKAIRFPGEPDQLDLSQFLSSVVRTERQMQMLVKRNPGGVVSVVGGGLAEHAWLYVWATADADLTQLASQLLEWQQGEETHVAQSEAMQGVGRPQESRLASAAGLGRKARELLPNSAVAGAERFIADYVVSLVPQAGEDRFDDAYWRKDDRGLFWKAVANTGWSK